MVISTNLNTSICCGYNEKIVKNDSLPKNVVSIQIQKIAIFNSDRKKSILFKTNHSDITTYNHLIRSTHSYIVDIL